LQPVESILQRTIAHIFANFEMHPPKKSITVVVGHRVQSTLSSGKLPSALDTILTGKWLYILHFDLDHKY
jgi:hypothetical protein